MFCDLRSEQSPVDIGVAIRYGEKADCWLARSLAAEDCGARVRIADQRSSGYDRQSQFVGVDLAGPRHISEQLLRATDCLWHQGDRINDA